MGAKPGDGDHAAVDNQHHDGVVQSQAAFRLDKEPVQVFRRGLELVVLVVLPHKGLHHPDGGDVLLDAGV